MIFFSLTQGPVRIEVTTEKMEVESSPLPPPKSSQVLGRPPECGNSGPTSLYSDGDIISCQVSYNRCYILYFFETV